MLNRFRGLIERGAYPHFIAERFYYPVGEINILFTLANIEHYLHNDSGNVCWGGNGVGHWNPDAGKPMGLEVMGNDDRGRILVACNGTGNCPYKQSKFGKCLSVTGRGRPNKITNVLTEREKEVVSRLKSLKLDVELIQDATGCNINSIMAFYMSGVYRRKKCPCGDIFYWVEEDGLILKDTSPHSCKKCSDKARKAALGLSRQYEDAHL